MRKQIKALILVLAVASINCNSAYAKHGSDDKTPEVEKPEHSILVPGNNGAVGTTPTSSPTASPTTSPSPSASPGASGSPTPAPTPIASANQRIVGKLTASTTGATNARGKIESRNKSKGNKSDNRFETRVYIPVPSTLPAVPDLNSLANLQLTLVLSRAGAPYAQCTLAFDSIETLGTAVFGEFKVDLRSRSNGIARSGRGNCDLDLVTADIQAGLPAVQANDTAEVKDASGVTFLSSTLLGK